MADPLDQIETIVILMMENRSFDHMLGYLSLPPYNRSLNGIQTSQEWLSEHSNPFNGDLYTLFHLKAKQFPVDPPHERYDISFQLGPPVNNVFPMNGFVGNYAVVQAISLDPAIAPLPAVMGYYAPSEVPITHFLAQSFTVCDNWFAPLPSSTQPNRLMAMSGISLIDSNQTVLPDQSLVYDWLNDHQVRWRVYHEGVPFFSLMPRWIPEILSSDRFVPFSRLVVDVQDESPDTFPQVIFVEPVYTDAPHLGKADDDHPPTSIDGGQEFLKRTYLSLISDPKRWAKTLLIITYDEHGGIYDHVSPQVWTTHPPKGANYPTFTSSGVRVPALLISPFVEPGTVYSGALDHTSILKLLGQKFGNGGGYSSEVDLRKAGDLTHALTRTTPRTDIQAPSGSPGFVGSVPQNVVAFQKAGEALFLHDPAQTKNKFPELWHF
ncbi:MAG: alkaline phosphatase family protein [Leptospirales bacterium]